MEVEGNSGRNGAPVRRDCERAEAEGVYVQPIPELLVQAQTVPRGNFDPRRNRKPAQIKTGGCPEDCAYCAQSVHYDTGLKATRATDRADVVAAAQRDKAAGASRFCMAAAWRSPKDRDLDKVCDMIAAVKRVGMETCVTLGMLTPKQAARLADAGLDFYNHNVDTSPEDQPVERGEWRAGEGHGGASRSDCTGAPGGDRADHDAQERRTVGRRAPVHE